MKQLIIDFNEQNYPSFASFLGDANQELLSVLKSGESKLTLVWGLDGTGKSHLLKSWVAKLSNENNKAIFVSINHSELLDDILENDYTYIAIDDIHLFDELNQIKLFNIFNKVMDTESCQLLVSSNIPPQRLDQIRDDLRTRLGLCLIYEVFPLTDDEKLQTMSDFVKLKQVNIGEEILKYLLQRSPRDLNFLLNTLQELDCYAIKNKRKITIPLLKQYLMEKTIE